MSRDHYPNFFTTTITQSAANALSTTEVQLPVVRVPSSGRVTIVELKSVEWGITSTTSPTAVDGENIVVGLSTSALVADPTTQLTPTIIMTDPTTVWCNRKNCRVITSGGGYMNDLRFVEKLQDPDGHGVLIATDALYIHVYSAGFAAAQSIYVKCGYSFVTAGLAEYIGIVQSQQ
jgi:hypothetical protein